MNGEKQIGDIVVTKLHPKCRKLLEDIRTKFFEKYGVKISYPNASKILAEKVINRGGIKEV